MTEDKKSYRDELRHSFMSHIKSSNRQHKSHPCSFLSDAPSQHFKGQPIQINQEFESGITEKQRKYQMDQAKISGGDADRYLYDPIHTSVYSDDSCPYRTEQFYPLRHSHCNNKTQSLTMSNKVTTGTGKYQTNTPQIAVPVEEYVGDHQCLFETVSNVGSDGCSANSQKSSKTVVSYKTSRDLRKLVKSKCKLQDVINEVVDDMCNPEDLDKSRNDVHNMLYDKSTIQVDTLPLTHCKHCTDKNHPSQSPQKDVTTEIGKSDFAESHNGDTLTISVDDVVNSKVINPMIRKLQRMYLNNLKEEMSLMEDLERLPHDVNEVYKATIFKNRE